jgi:fibro-slime domain-containing protein
MLVFPAEKIYDIQDSGKINPHDQAPSVGGDSWWDWAGRDNAGCTGIAPTTMGAEAWGRERNQHFCFETHAEFTYTATGQTFSFRGDDDIWVFINNKRVVDNGGMHLPAPGMVKLDDKAAALGLKVDGTYPIDIFFCDRQPTSSNVRIKTSMYFKQKKGLFWEENPPGSGTYQISKVVGGDGSCLSTGDKEQIIPGKELTLSYTLLNARGDSVTSEREGVFGGYLEPGKVHFKGIDLTTPGTVKLNKNAIEGLAPSRYRLMISTDDGQRTFITFTIQGNLVIEPKTPVEALAGVLVPIYVQNFVDGFIDAMDVPYSLNIPEGLRVWDDPGKKKEIDGADQLYTGSDGIDTLWVSGTKYADEVKTYTIRIAGSKDPGRDMTFYLPNLHFTSKIGGTDFIPGTNTATWVKQKDSVFIRAIDPKDSTTCFTCNDTLKFDGDPRLEYYTGQGSPTSFIVLDSGYAKFFYAASDSVKNVSFKVKGPSALMVDSIVKITRKLPPVPIPTFAMMYDDNNDGIGDRFVVRYNKSVKDKAAADSLIYVWPKDGKDTVRLYKSELATMYSPENDSILVFTGEFSEEILTGVTGSVITWYTFKDDDTGLFVTLDSPEEIQDGIPPLVTEAIIYPKDNQQVDELHLTLSEPVYYDSVDVNEKYNLFYFVVFGDQVYRQVITAKEAIWTDVPGEDGEKKGYSDKVTLYMSNLEGVLRPNAGDSIRIAFSADKVLLKDLAGNFASPEGRLQLIEGEKRVGIDGYEKPFPFDPNDQGWKDQLEANGDIYLKLIDPTSTIGKEVEVNQKTLGWMVKIDLSDIYALAKQNDPTVKPEDVVFKYDIDFHTNLGAWVNGKKGQSISCNDNEVYGGDCSGQRGAFFIGWNLVSDAGRAVGSGAYISTLKTRVEVKGKKWVRTDRTTQEIWGIQRTAGAQKVLGKE